MRLNGWTLAVVVLLSSTLPAQYFEGRNSAMGGTGVASSRYLAAPLANPALLMNYKDGDNIGVILPTVGAQVSDPDDLTDGIDELQDSIDVLEERLNNLTATPADRQNVIDRLVALNGRTLHAELGANVVVAVPGPVFSYALVARNHTDVMGFPTIDAGDPAIIQGATTPSDLDALQSQGRALSAAVSEVGVAVAFGLELAGFGVSVGVTPKYQRIDTYNYSVNVDNFDEDDYDDKAFREEDTAFNADIGATVSLPQGLTVGAMVRNVVPDDYETVLTNGQIFDYRVSTVATIGVAWSQDMFTIAAEADVTTTERFDLDDESQYMRVGAELAGDWAALRVGYQHDTKDGTEDLITAGVGLSPFNVIHLDIAGMLGDDNSYGGVIQVGFTF